MKDHYPTSQSVASHRPFSEGYHAVLNVGCFAFALMCEPGISDAHVPLTLPPDVAPYFTRIFPAVDRPVAWPSTVMDEAALRHVSGVGEDDWRNWSPEEGASRADALTDTRSARREHL